MSDLKRLSKFLSLVLRHQPQVAFVTLDPQGWVRIDDLIDGANRAGTPITRMQLDEIVLHNDKQRFAVSQDGTRIRASQGHSVEVDLQLEPAVPPTVLYHGTPVHAVQSIRKNGLTKQTRQHVHLSETRATAEQVGSRRGKAIVLCINAYRMWQAGFVFYRSANGVWLTNHVPVRYMDGFHE